MPGKLKSLTVITPSGYIMDVRGRGGNAIVNVEFNALANYSALNKAHRWLAAEGWFEFVAGYWEYPAEIDARR